MAKAENRRLHEEARAALNERDFLVRKMKALKECLAEAAGEARRDVLRWQREVDETRSQLAAKEAQVASLAGELQALQQSLGAGTDGQEDAAQLRQERDAAVATLLGSQAYSGALGARIAALEVELAQEREAALGLNHELDLLGARLRGAEAERDHLTDRSRDLERRMREAGEAALEALEAQQRVRDLDTLVTEQKAEILKLQQEVVGLLGRQQQHEQQLSDRDAKLQAKSRVSDLRPSSIAIQGARLTLAPYLRS